MLKKFISYYRDHKGLLFLDLFCATILSGLNLAFPVFTKIFIDDFIPNKEIQKIFGFGMILIGLYVFRLITVFIVDFWGHIMGARIEHDMRRDLFKKIQTLNFDFFDENKTGQLMARLVGDLRDISEVAHHVPEDLFISTIMIIGSFTILMNYNTILTLIILGLITFLIIFTTYRRKKMLNGFRQVRIEHAEINAQVESTLGGIRLMKSYNNEDYELTKFSKNNKMYRESWRNAYKQMAIFASGNSFIIDSIYVVVLVIGGYFIYQKNLTFGQFSSYIIFVNILIQPIRRLIQSIQQIQSGLAGIERFYEIMTIDPKIKTPKNYKILKDPEGKIEFKDVSFSYDNNEKHILRNFNVKIEPGKTVAIVGETGVGKSTISQLIPRFYDVNEGEILVDNINIREYKLDSLRRTIGHVQQDVYIFWGTIKENILYGNPDASDEKVIDAAKKAKLHDFIMTLDNGYDTLVGERGVKLSGGQKQRISIARVFIKDPKILILDEATSSLDNITETQIQEALDELAKNRTSIIIAHRLSTIKHADEILVLTKHGISERGTHKDLISRDGYYSKLYNASLS